MQTKTAIATPPTKPAMLPVKATLLSLDVEAPRNVDEVERFVNADGWDEVRPLPWERRPSTSKESKRLYKAVNVRGRDGRVRFGEDTWLAFMLRMRLYLSYREWFSLAMVFWHCRTFPRSQMLLWMRGRSDMMLEKLMGIYPALARQTCDIHRKEKVVEPTHNTPLRGMVKLTPAQSADLERQYREHRLAWQASRDVRQGRQAVRLDDTRFVKEGGKRLLVPVFPPSEELTSMDFSYGLYEVALSRTTELRRMFVDVDFHSKSFFDLPDPVHAVRAIIRQVELFFLRNTPAAVAFSRIKRATTSVEGITDWKRGAHVVFLDLYLNVTEIHSLIDRLRHALPQYAHAIDKTTNGMRPMYSVKIEKCAPCPPMRKGDNFISSLPYNAMQWYLPGEDAPTEQDLLVLYPYTGIIPEDGVMHDPVIIEGPRTRGNSRVATALGQIAQQRAEYDYTNRQHRGRVRNGEMPSTREGEERAISYGPRVTEAWNRVLEMFPPQRGDDNWTIYGVYERPCALGCGNKKAVSMSITTVWCPEKRTFHKSNHCAYTVCTDCCHVSSYCMDDECKQRNVRVHKTWRRTGLAGWIGPMDPAYSNLFSSSSTVSTLSASSSLSMPMPMSTPVFTPASTAPYMSVPYMSSVPYVSSLPSASSSASPGHGTKRLLTGSEEDTQTEWLNAGESKERGVAESRGAAAEKRGSAGVSGELAALLARPVSKPNKAGMPAHLQFAFTPFEKPADSSTRRGGRKKIKK